MVPEHEKQTADGTGLEPAGDRQHHPKHSKQKWIFAIAVLRLIVVLAAVIGGGAWLRKHNSSASPTSAKYLTTGTISATKSSSSTLPSPMKASFRSKIAAVSYDY